VTKERLADALLMAAMDWQNGHGTCGLAWTEGKETWLSLTDFPTDFLVADLATSAAISEVAGMGFDLQNDDGSDCEKVAVVDWPRSDDENRYIMRPVRK